MDKWQSIQKFVKPLLPYMISVLVGAGVAFASPIKNWTSGEYVTYSDLNATLNHLHNSVGHNHGPVITAADISASAGIRPEQTTFGSNINRNLVFVGSFMANPDGGTSYLPINTSGTLAVTVSKQSTYGVRIEGAASSGLLSDGGTAIYTVLFNTIGTFAYSEICRTMTGSTNLTAPLSFVLRCSSWGGTWPLADVNPNDIAFAIYSNAVN